MIRTQEEIDAQIAGLEDMKSWLPEYNIFNDPNWKKIDAQIDVLRGERTASDYEDGLTNEDFEDDIADAQIFRAAEEAEDWLNGVGEESLFETRN